MQLKKGVLTAFFAIVLLGLISCRGVGVSVDPETRLRDRVEGFILARQEADQIALQGFYLEPGKARLGNIRYRSSEIAEISFIDKGKRAQVKLKNTMQAMGFTFKDMPQTINWAWEKGDWYLVVDVNAGNPFATHIKKSSNNDNDQKK